MKQLWTVLAFASLLTLPAFGDDTNAVAPKKIGTLEAAKHYDENLTVTGKVVQVTIREKIVFVNLDKPHPDSPFTAVIFAANTNQFGDLAALKDKAVEMTGKIKNYNDSPEMVLDSTNQLKILDSVPVAKPEQK